MSQRNRQKREVNTVWRDYTSKLLQLLRSEEAGSIMLEESHMLGLIASSQSPEQHLQRLHRYIHWDSIKPTEPKILEVYEDSPEDALELWIDQLQPTGSTRQTNHRQQVKADFETMSKPVPAFVFGYRGR